jgi:hypothetical protein
VIPRSVFISYRRDQGDGVAQVVKSELEKRGFDAFLDVDDLGGGHFDVQLLGQIEKRPYFVVILSKGCLDRCSQADDFMRREIAHAIRLAKKIVPVMLRNFEWPAADSLPADIRDLQRHNAFEYSHSHWSLTREKFVRMLVHAGDLREIAISEPTASGDAPQPSERKELAKSSTGMSAPSVDQPIETLPHISSVGVAPQAPVASDLGGSVGARKVDVPAYWQQAVFLTVLAVLPLPLIVSAAIPRVGLGYLLLIVPFMSPASMFLIAALGYAVRGTRRRRRGDLDRARSDFKLVRRLMYWGIVIGLLLPIGAIVIGAFGVFF